MSISSYDYKQRLSVELPDELNPKLNPVKIVLLPDELNKFSGIVDVHLVLGGSLPTGSIKFSSAYSLLQNAYQKGHLDSIETLVEASSGNMVYSLAKLAPYFGIKRLVAVVSNNLTPAKLERLIRCSDPSRGFAVEVIYPDGGETTLETARRLGRQDGWHNMDQYKNPANPQGQADWLIKPLYDKTAESLKVLAIALGSTGTAIGARELMENKNHCEIVGGYGEVPGARTYNRLQEVGFDWTSNIKSFEITPKEAYEKSKQLYEAGISVGPSSGLALAVLMRYLEDVLNNPTEKKRLGWGHQPISAGVICGDGIEVYLDQYSKNLGG
jgi:cysteine synthase B